MSTRSAATKVVWFRIPILFLLVVCADSCVGINPMSSPKANRDMKRFYEEGTEAFAAEDYQRAVNNYSRALDISSGWLMLKADMKKNLWAYATLNRGCAYYGAGEYHKALADLSVVAKSVTAERDAVTEETRKPTQWFRMEKKVPKALKCLAGAAYTNRSVVHYAMGDKAKSLADLTLAIEWNPEEGTAYHNRAFLYLERDEPELAIADLSRALALPTLVNDALKADILLLRARAYEAQEKREEAEKDRSAASEVASTVESLPLGSKGSMFLVPLSPK